MHKHLPARTRKSFGRSAERNLTSSRLQMGARKEITLKRQTILACLFCVGGHSHTLFHLNLKLEGKALLGTASLNGRRVSFRASPLARNILAGVGFQRSLD